MTDPSAIGDFEATPVDELAYEQAFAHLEEIVGALESQEYALEKTLAMYERGQKLAHYCAELLDKAELQLKQLAGEEMVDFTPPE